MTFEVWEATESQGLAAWLACWHTWPTREVFAHPEYVALFAAQHHRVVCLGARTEGGGILFPLILRPLACEPWGVGRKEWDAVSPYGYGGPFAWNATDEDARAFWSAVECWARSENLVTCFARLSLFPEQQLLVKEAQEVAANVVRTLELPQEALWREYDHKVRKNVEKARRSGLRFEVDPAGARIAEFLEIYNSTMDRRSATAGYYFGEVFFRRIVERLRGSFCFTHVLQETRTVSTELILVSQENIYSFLGGTRAEAFPLRPNDLLKHETALWGMREGKRSYVLGGGYQPGDGIFRYKAAFAPAGHRPFRVWRRVFSESAEEELTSLRRGWELQRGSQWEPRPDFFPGYRS